MSVATLPAPTLTSNSDGTQTSVFYRINDAGRRVKVTRKIRTETTEAHTPESRRQWAKYGEAIGETVKPQIAEEIVLRLFPKTAKPGSENEQGSEKKVPTKRVTCKFCGGDHLSFQCPLKDKLATPGAAPGVMGGMPGVGGMPGAGMPGARPGSVPPPPMGGMPPPGAAGGKYVPPALRGGPGMGAPGVPGKYVPPALRGGPPGVPMPGGMPGSMGPMGQQRDESTTLRVSNLPDDIQEIDLRNNFGKVARVVRCHLARNKATNRSRGFAFVVYNTREEAERARQTFDGVAVENMIMHVDFALPRE